MRALNSTAADIDMRSKYFLRFYAVDEHADSCYISERIHRSDFMEVDLVHRHSVHLALRCGDYAVDSKNVLPDCFRKIQMVFHDMCDVCRAVV